MQQSSWISRTVPSLLCTCIFRTTTFTDCERCAKCGRWQHRTCARYEHTNDHKGPVCNPCFGEFLMQKKRDETSRRLRWRLRQVAGNARNARSNANTSQQPDGSGRRSSFVATVLNKIETPPGLSNGALPTSLGQAQLDGETAPGDTTSSPLSPPPGADVVTVKQFIGAFLRYGQNFEGMTSTMPGFRHLKPVEFLSDATTCPAPAPQTFHRFSGRDPAVSYAPGANASASATLALATASNSGTSPRNSRISCKCTGGLPHSGELFYCTECELPQHRVCSLNLRVELPDLDTALCNFCANMGDRDARLDSTASASEPQPEPEATAPISFTAADYDGIFTVITPIMWRRWARITYRPNNEIRTDSLGHEIFTPHDHLAPPPSEWTAELQARLTTLFNFAQPDLLHRYLMPPLQARPRNDQQITRAISDLSQRLLFHSDGRCKKKDLGLLTEVFGWADKGSIYHITEN